jgi:enoyl-CoA hydratase
MWRGARLLRGRRCDGGLRRPALEEGAGGAAFFMEEYRLNDLLYAYPRPVVAFMDGITMGGGVGQPACPRATASPTHVCHARGGIGLFPDVGGGGISRACRGGWGRGWR